MKMTETIRQEHPPLPSPTLSASLHQLWYSAPSFPQMDEMPCSHLRPVRLKPWMPSLLPSLKHYSSNGPISFLHHLFLHLFWIIPIQTKHALQSPSKKRHPPPNVHPLQFSASSSTSLCNKTTWNIHLYLLTPFPYPMCSLPPVPLRICPSGFWEPSFSWIFSYLLSPSLLPISKCCSVPRLRSSFLSTLFS